MSLPFFRSQPPKPAFVAHVCAWIRRLGYTDRLEPRLDRFQILLQPSGLQFNLDNLYRDYGATSIWQRNALVRRYVTSCLALVLQAQEQPAPSADRLLPALRDLVYPLMVAAQGDGTAARTEATVTDMVPHQMLAGCYLIQPVLDYGDRMGSIRTQDITALQMTVDQAVARAIANLKEQDSPFVTLAPGLWASQQRDCYDAARLLLVDRIRRLPDVGKPVVIPVHRNELLIADAGMPAALTQMAALAEAHFREDRSIGLVPLILDGDTWRVFEPPVDDAHIPIHRIGVLGWMDAYTEQKQLLDADHERTGVDIFTASYTAVAGKQTGRCRSYCVWSKDVVALLPRTEFVALSADATGKQITMYRWGDLIPRCGHLLQRTEHLLPRWKTTGFPGPAELDGLTPD